MRGTARARHTLLTGVFTLYTTMNAFSARLSTEVVVVVVSRGRGWKQRTVRASQCSERSALHNHLGVSVLSGV